MDNISCVNALWVCSVDVATRPSIPVKYASDRPRHDEGIVAAAVGQHGEAAQNSLQCVRGLANGISPWRGCRLGRGIGVFRPGEGGGGLARTLRSRSPWAAVVFPAFHLPGDPNMYLFYFDRGWPESGAHDFFACVFGPHLKARPRKIDPGAGRRPCRRGTWNIRALGGVSRHNMMPLSIQRCTGHWCLLGRSARSRGGMTPSMRAAMVTQFMFSKLLTNIC